MASETLISSNELETPQAHPVVPNIRSYRGLFLAVLGAVIFLAALNVVQLVFTYRLAQSFSERGTNAVKLDNLSKSIDGLTVMVGENSKKVEDVNGLSQKVDVLTGMVGGINSGANPQPASAGLASPAFHLRFLCTDASTGEKIASCPIRVKILAAEPAAEFEIQGNNQEAITLPVRLRLSISVQAKGYKPFASVFEFTETGAAQDYAIKLEK